MNIKQWNMIELRVITYGYLLLLKFYLTKFAFVDSIYIILALKVLLLEKCIRTKIRSYLKRIHEYPSLLRITV